MAKPDFRDCPFCGHKKTKKVKVKQQNRYADLGYIVNIEEMYKCPRCKNMFD